jgi:hypothetical protein
VLYGSITNLDSLRIDINEDGFLDFRFHYKPFSGGLYFYVGSLNSNCTYHNFSISDTISLNNSTIIWNSGEMFWDNFSLIDRMFAIKLKFGVDEYYGWIHAIAGHTKDGTMTIDKYAFCKISNFPFHLGQTELISSINEFVKESEISISPNPFTQSTQITLPQTYRSITLEVYNLQGQQVAQYQYANCDKIQLMRNHLGSGLYFLKLTLDDGVVRTGKVVVSE